jgi:hypothetical protein
MHDRASRPAHANVLLGVEYLLVIFDRPGRTFANDCRIDGMKSFRNCFDGAHISSLSIFGLGAQGRLKQREGTSQFTLRVEFLNTPGWLASQEGILFLMMK